jgi:peptide/nickel transport system permease protein/oligopeptide transport system permease protein
MARFILRRICWGIIVLILIAYVSFLAQDFARLARTNQPAPLGEVIRRAVIDTGRLLQRIPSGDLGLYTSQRGAYGARSARPVGDLLGSFAVRSLALLGLATALGGIIGTALGLLGALWRGKGVSLGLILLSIVGISAPSFLLGMLLQFLEILFYRNTGISLLPVGGFGWDEHLVLPVLVLMARPLAQVARLSYAEFTTILGEDYVRTARAKGVRDRRIWMRHIVPNAAITILTAMGTSLRFSLSSLPVVEFLFGWPGMGRAMLEMLRTYQRDGATVLILTMGAVFVVVNTALDALYRVIDPRLRESQTRTRIAISVSDWSSALVEGAWATLTLRRWREKRRLPTQAETPPLPDPRPATSAQAAGDAERMWRQSRRHAWGRALRGNPALILGAMLAGVLLVLVIAGPAVARHNVYTSGNPVWVNGQQKLPPAAPSPIYPLGTDVQGRDILSLILVGARRTLSMALFAAAARLLVGGLLGFLAGWFSGSRLDRVIMSVAEAIGAFPSLLLAMLIVYGVGVQQGMIAFVIALAATGWGEVMQTVRSRVMGIKPMAYIESAMSTGLSQGQILSAHVLPNVWPMLVSVAFLEMGGVLMILGELGFLGVFIGGGLAAEGDGAPALIYYDVPEWSVMLANSWRSFRSFPWATLYPALAFFAAILGFTLLGEGLRWLSERMTLSLRGLFNRYTLAVTLVAVLGVNIMFASTGLPARYAPLAKSYDASRAMEDVRWLAQPEFNGRLSGSPDADRVAEWIAAEFEAIGLQPSGQEIGGYFQTLPNTYRDLIAQPELAFENEAGERVVAEYGVDFVRAPGPFESGGIGSGELVLVHESLRSAYSSSQVAHAYGIPADELSRQDRILLNVLPQESGVHILLGHDGQLLMAPDPLEMPPYELLVEAHRTTDASRPMVRISQGFIARLLAGSAVSLEDALRRAETGESVYVPTGWRAELSLASDLPQGVPSRHVIAIWPGEDVVYGREVVIVSAYYDGLGRSPDGTLYPGANDNASGVATMLEIARTLKEQHYKPKRTILFVAWCGGERHRAVNYSTFMDVRPGYREFWEIVATLEIDGVGAGSGRSVAVERSSRQRLTAVVQEAARRVRTPVTTREAGLHANAELWPRSAQSIPGATLSWAGSDSAAHSPDDTAENVDPQKMAAAGRMASLAVMVLAADPAY